MKRDKWLEELSNKVNEVPSQVNPSLWAGIQSQIAAPTILGMSVAAAKVVGLVASVVVVSGVTVIALTNREETTKSNKDLNKEIRKDTSETEPSLSSTKEITQNIEKDVKLEKLTKESNTISFKLDNAGKVEEEITKEKDLPFTISPTVSEPVVSVAPKVVKVENEKIEEKESSIVKQKETATRPKAIEKQEVVTETSKPAFKLIDLPNVFTPNGDGINDLFHVEVEGILDFSLVVLNDKGITVWKSADSKEKWDGRTMSGEPAQKGDYIYMITGMDENKKRVAEYRKLRLQ
ncbi:MAG: gliding motility-associated C-terminal domain-containing protein [Bacteroidetes bacterium]|nr:gliding motility-associated C-terminal domain-containing protein [Bacteroidota bacterium]